MGEPEFSSDPWLDARLRNVPLPVGFLVKLQEIGNAETQQLDAALRDVPVPPGLLDRLRSISRRPQRMAQWRQMALAASLMFTVGLGTLALVGYVANHFAGQPLAKQAPRGGEHAGDVAALERNADPDSREERFADRRSGDSLADESEAADAELDSWPAPAHVALDDLAPRTVPEIGPGPAPALPKPQRRLDSLQRDDLLGARGAADVLPDLDSVEIHLPRGLTPPLVAGYDLLFQLKNGLHPPVDPSAHQDLRSVQLPLVTSSAGYRRARRWLKEGRLPAAADLRTEEFLAAVDYRFPTVSAGRVAIRTAAGPAPLRDQGVSLLQVAVQAGALPHETHGPTHLTIVLDMSAGMRRSDRWAAVQVATARLRDAMGPADRVTLIGYSDQPELLVDSVGREEAGKLVSALQASSPRRAANLAAGLNLACSVMPRQSDATATSEFATSQAADTKPTDAASSNNIANNIAKTAGAAAPGKVEKPADAAAMERRILVISSGRVDADRPSAKRASERLATLARAGVSLQVLDLGRSADLALSTGPAMATGTSSNGAAAGGAAANVGPDADAKNAEGKNASDLAGSDALAAWAAVADGRLVRVADPSALAWNLIEALIGRSPVVAARTSLRVTFNPNVVAAYRLIGHERTTITGPALSQTEVDLRAGESATGLFEVWLKPGGGNDVATVEVAWQEPSRDGGSSSSSTGKAQRAKQTVARSQFAQSFTGSAPSLQVAALAALSAETLRGSTFAPASRSLARVAELAHQLSPTVLGQPSARELVDFIERAERVRMHGSALRRSADRTATP